MTLKRFSTRNEKLDKEFLAKALEGATSYLRIAGYFRSSIFELVGELISKIPEVKILCNSELDYLDFQVATNRGAALKEKWNQFDIEADSMIHSERYQRLNTLLKSGRVEIRVVPKEQCFVHGKAGVITYPDKRKISFVGSVNETKSAFSHNYELVWQDDEKDSAEWVEKEFWALWHEKGVPLPETILSEIDRIANRQEITVNVLSPTEIPGAALAEAPIYRGGEQLQPWQRSFVALFLEHRESYDKVRLLLADEVGVGKTFSMAASALVSALLKDGPVLILAPSTLTTQWQIELIDKLGIPSAVWSSQKKCWIGEEGQELSPKDGDYIRKCPYQIGIVSTGLIFHQKDETGFVKEAAKLLKKQYGCVILDEAHKARAKGSFKSQETQPNNLLQFMLEVGKQTRHLILGTATPIQTQIRELWDLLEILNSNASFVLGNKESIWHDWEQAADIVTGKKTATDEKQAWDWLSNPLPPHASEPTVTAIREAQEIPADQFEIIRDFDDLDHFTREHHLCECLAQNYFKLNNPVLRHVVLRKRSELEEMGLLEKVGVKVHPVSNRNDLYESRFVELGLMTNNPFRIAYEQAEEFCKLLQKRTKSAGFMKSLMLQRICSSFAAGLSTATKMLSHSTIENIDEDLANQIKEEHLLDQITPQEIICLKEIQTQLSRKEAKDPKLETILWFLNNFKSDNKTWLEHGCIIFSQYYDTAAWVASHLAANIKNEVIAVYAGAGKSGLYKNDKFTSVERDSIKTAVKKRDLRIVVATDAACEGLNLQTLGTLINIDLPWNPSKLEQRLGRIKRFGQTRKMVDMLNLVYHETRDQKVYQVLSDRLKDTYDIFGSLPDTIEDDWIEDETKLKEELDIYIHKRKESQNAFTIKYKDTLDPEAHRWEKCVKVLSRRNITAQLKEGW